MRDPYKYKKRTFGRTDKLILNSYLSRYVQNSKKNCEKNKVLLSDMKP